MADLVVDLDLLAETAGGLGMLVHEFERASDIVADHEPAIGRNALLDEMREFVDGWRRNREKLRTALRSLYERATGCREAFVQGANDRARWIQTAVEECRP